MLNSFFDLLFPPVCHGCEQPLVVGEKFLCLSCVLELPKTNSHLHGNKLRLGLPVSNAFAMLKYFKEGRVQQLLHALKYEQAEELAVHLGRLYGKELEESGFSNQWDIIIPVPLHWRRFLWRGYNQSYRFAEGLSESLGIETKEGILVRGRYTQVQAKRKGTGERLKNIKGAFVVKAPQKVAGKKILLVDDVVTTGATIDACIRPLLDAGAKEVSLACIAATTFD